MRTVNYAAEVDGQEMWVVTCGRMTQPEEPRDRMAARGHESVLLGPGGIFSGQALANSFIYGERYAPTESGFERVPRGEIR